MGEVKGITLNSNLYTEQEELLPADDEQDAKMEEAKPKKEKKPKKQKALPPSQNKKKDPILEAKEKVPTEDETPPQMEVEHLSQLVDEAMKENEQES